MRVAIPGINETDIHDLYDGDLAVYLAVLRSYADNTPAAVKNLRKVSYETLSDYAVVIHNLKGSSASICAEEIRAEAAKLEAMARAGDAEGVLAGNAAFVQKAEELLLCIEKWLGQLNGQAVSFSIA